MIQLTLNLQVGTFSVYSLLVNPQAVLIPVLNSWSALYLCVLSYALKTTFY